MSGYSIDLRERVIKAWESGKTQAWIAEIFSIGESSIKRYIQRYGATDSVAPTQQGRKAHLITEAHRALIETMVGNAPQGKLEQYCQM